MANAGAPQEVILPEGKVTPLPLPATEVHHQIEAAKEAPNGSCPVSPSVLGILCLHTPNCRRGFEGVGPPSFPGIDLEANAGRSKAVAQVMG